MDAWVARGKKGMFPVEYVLGFGKCFKHEHDDGSVSWGSGKGGATFHRKPKEFPTLKPGEGPLAVRVDVIALEIPESVKKKKRKK
jgi:hypothetical protein